MLRLLIISALSILLQEAVCLRADDCACRIITPTDQEIAVLDSKNQDDAKAGFEKLIKKHFDLDATKDPQLIDNFPTSPNPVSPAAKAASAFARLVSSVTPASGGAGSPVAATGAQAAAPAAPVAQGAAPTPAVTNAVSPVASGSNAATPASALTNPVASYAAVANAVSASSAATHFPVIQPPFARYVAATSAAPLIGATPYADAPANECSSTEAPPTEALQTEAPQDACAYAQSYSLPTLQSEETSFKPCNAASEQPAPYAPEQQLHYAHEQPSSDAPQDEPDACPAAPENSQESDYPSPTCEESVSSGQLGQTGHSPLLYGAYYSHSEPSSIPNVRSTEYASLQPCDSSPCVQNVAPPVAVAAAPDVSYPVPPSEPCHIQQDYSSINDIRHVNTNEGLSSAGCVPVTDRVIIPQEEKLVRHLPVVNKVLRNVVEFVTRHVPVIRHRNRTIEETYTVQVPITENITTTVVDSVLKKVPVVFIRQKPVIHKTIRHIPVVETRYRPVEQVTVTNVPVRQRIIKNVVDYSINPTTYPCNSQASPTLYAPVVPVVPYACSSIPPCATSVVAPTVVRRR